MLRVLTWNLFGLRDELLDERTEAACLAMLLREPMPDVVFLQEVVRRSWHGHLRHHFRAAGFTPFPPDPTETDSTYFVVAFLGSRVSGVRGTVTPLPATRMGRVLLGVEGEVDGLRVRLYTAHLESLRDGRRARRLQLEEVARVLRSDATPGLFAGDTNLRDEEVASVDLDGITDGWEVAGSPPAFRDTWTAHGGGTRARYDRVLLRGFTVPSFTFVGERPFGEGKERVSDHVGVEVVVDASASRDPSSGDR